MRFLVWLTTVVVLLTAFNATAYFTGLDLPWWGNFLVGVVAGLIGNEIDDPVTDWLVARRKRKGEGSS